MLLRTSFAPLIACVAWFCVGCDDGSELAPPSGTGDPSTSSSGAPVPIAPCAEPAEGCPCSEAGAAASCSKISKSYGDYIVCSQGTTRCDGSRWSACSETGEMRTRVLSGYYEVRDLAAEPGACANACSQSCATYTDTPGGLVLDPDGGLVTGDGGLSLVPRPADEQTTCTSLRITPNTQPSTNLVITNPAALNTLQFTATLLPAGCFAGLVQPLWSIDRFDIAQISDGGRLHVVTPIAGPIQVSAYVGRLQATATAHVTVQVATAGTSNPPPAGVGPTQFASPTATADSTLEILYPYDETVLPLGLSAPLLQWRNGGTAASGVQITLRYPLTGSNALYTYSEVLSESMTQPVPLRTAQPRAVLNQDAWRALEQTVNRNRATHGDTAEIIVHRRIGSTVRASKRVRVRFAAGQLKGRVYYNSYGTSLVSNYTGAIQSSGGAFPNGRFGAATLAIVPGESIPRVVAGNEGCRVCHSANAAGTKLVTTGSANPYDSYEYLLPGGASRRLRADQNLIFPAVNPDGSRYYSNGLRPDGDTQSRLYDANGSLVGSATQPSNLNAAYPSFSTDGRQVAFNFRTGSASPLANPPSPTSGDGRTLSMMSFDGNRTFSGFRHLHTPSSGAAVWPAFLPAGQGGVVFQREVRQTPNGGLGYTRSDCDSTGTCNDQGATGELWWVSTGATPRAARLDRANGWLNGQPALPVSGSNRHVLPSANATWHEQVYNFEPSVLPTTLGGYSWIAFTSRRMYGNVATINPYSSDPRFRDISIDPTPKKLWMAAIADDPTPGADPSAPAFYLPGQELIAGNSRAVFALDACKPAGPPSADNLCDSDLDCCGAPATASCVLDPPPLASPPTRHCVSVSGQCKQIGETCTQDAQCCDFAAGSRCASGSCQSPPPVFFDASYTRDYFASCGPGERPLWRLFEWQSATPVGTRIAFAAQTRELASEPWAPAAPVAFGLAQAPPVQTNGWANGGKTIEQVLREVAVPARSWLRVTATLYASADRAFTPTLQQWRATYDCVAAE